MEKYLKIKNQLAREMLAEAFGTLILCAFGLASIAQFIFNKGVGSFLSVNISFGFGATIAGVVIGKVSGKLTFITLFKIKFQLEWLSINNMVI